MVLSHAARLAAARRVFELADIFRAFGEAYRRNHPLPVSHFKVIEAVETLPHSRLGEAHGRVRLLPLWAPRL
jgi:hypothetical protein